MVKKPWKREPSLPGEEERRPKGAPLGELHLQGHVLPGPLARLPEPWGQGGVERLEQSRGRVFSSSVGEYPTPEVEVIKR